MNPASRPDTSLLGAILVAEELVTQEQLDTCLMLQQQDHPNLPIGEVLVGYGYLKRHDLEQALALQRSIRETLITRVDTQGPPLPDMRALIVGAGRTPALDEVLRNSGVTPHHLRRNNGESTQVYYDLILIAPDMLEALIALPAHNTLLGLLPATAWEDGPLSREVKGLLERYIEQARANLAIRSELEVERHHQYELRMIDMLLRNVAGASTPHEALLKLMMIIRDLVAVEVATLYRIDGDTKSLVFEVVLGPYRLELTNQRIPLNHGVVGWVALHGEPLILPDVRRDERFTGALDTQTGFQSQSMLCVPMYALGEIRGVLQLINKLGSQFDEQDMLMLRLTAAVGGVILMLQAEDAGPEWLKQIAGNPIDTSL